MAGHNSNVKMLEASADEETESYLRFLVDNKFVKYLVVDPGVLRTDQICFAPELLSLLPNFPPGEWNEARISKDPTTGKPEFSETIRKDFEGITSVWHPKRIDFLELETEKKLRTGIYEVLTEHFPQPVIAKYARFEWEVDYRDQETAAYKWIEGHDIGPRFLGHLTEEGRVIGFLMEKVEGARHATPDDLDACQKILSKVHKLGILHGDVNKHNFLVKDGAAILLDFEGAEKVDSDVPLREEMESLLQELQDTSGKGGSQIMPADFVYDRDG